MNTASFSSTKNANYFNDTLALFNHLFRSSQNYAAGLSRYTTDFFMPFLISTLYFRKTESNNLLSKTPLSTFISHLELLDFNRDLARRGMLSALSSANRYTQSEMGNYFDALLKAYMFFDHRDLAAFFERQDRLLDTIAHVYPQAIADIEPEFGFHFERGLNPLVAETDRFYLYRITPTDTDIKMKPDGKPIMILPPYVLGANILGFLPQENRSYAHCFANQGIPTYIRILKDITTCEPLQTMSGEDDANDTRLFCETLMKTHGKPVTINGYCQGGFTAVCNFLSGELDGLADALLTCVAPMDGTRSKGLSGFLGGLPQRFNDLAYGTKTLKNGNQVADGKLMGWVYKLASIEAESPVTVFYRDLMMFARQKSEKPVISKTAAALNYWLMNERNDLPLEITKMSFASYNTPITADGTLPVTLFGRKLNFNRLKEKKIPWLICYGEHDDLVEKTTALAPLDYIEAEVTPFPKGHVAIATSWSASNSTCPLHGRFGENEVRGPVRFQLDLDQTFVDQKG
jgi:hypothetical protein